MPLPRENRALHEWPNHFSSRDNLWNQRSSFSGSCSLGQTCSIKFLNGNENTNANTNANANAKLGIAFVLVFRI